MKLFYLQFSTTTYCNQNCSYCDIKDKSHSAGVEFDVDRLKWALDNLDADLFIELSGGEPGLVKNLPDAYRVLRDHPRVKRTQLMSNGLARINFPDLVTVFDRYNEHSIVEISDTSISKFYDMDLCYNENARNVVVLTKSTTESIIRNFDYFKDIGLFNEDHFWLKNYVQRTTKLDEKHWMKLIALYNKIGSEYARHSASQLMQESVVSQTTCRLIGFQPVINIQENVIQHCAYHIFNNPVEKELTEENLELLLDKKLFMDTNPGYCKNCNLYQWDYRMLLKKKVNCDFPN